MQKTLLYLAILAILGFGVWFFLFSDKSGQMFSSADANFGIRDTGMIGKIFIAANDNPNSITIERKGEGWIVNNTYPVLQSTLKQLLNTIYNQKATYPVPDKQRDGVIRSLLGGAIKTEIYDREGRKMRTFYVGGEVRGFAGTAMLMEGSERPYVVQIPGFDGYLTTRYSTEMGMWRDRIVFAVEPQDIEQISVRYAQEPLNSFTITQQNGKVSVALDTALHNTQPLNEGRVRSYLTFFKKIYCEAYATGMIDLDTIVRQMPEKATIDIRGAGGYHQQARIIYFPIDKRSKNTEKQVTSFDDNFHSDRYFAVINGGKDTATVQTHTFEKVFRRGYEFFMPDDPKQGTPAVPGEVRQGNSPIRQLAN